MISDYSSIIFDFAITRRPILLFTHDLEHYRDELRGLCIDLEREAPGPMVRTPGELLAALRDLDRTAWRRTTANPWSASWSVT